MIYQINARVTLDIQAESIDEAYEIADSMLEDLQYQCKEININSVDGKLLASKSSKYTITGDMNIT